MAASRVWADEFWVPPHVGHFITMNDDSGIGKAYEVVAVLHPMEPGSTAGDLIVRYLGTQSELRQRIGALQ